MKLKMLAVGVLVSLPLWASAKDVTIIYTNDLHAHVEPYKVPWIANGTRDIGGWANITTMVKQEKTKNSAHARWGISPDSVVVACYPNRYRYHEHHEF